MTRRDSLQTDRTWTEERGPTVLQLLGLDHKRLTYRFGGRDVTLPDVHGEVVPALIG